VFAFFVLCCSMYIQTFRLADRLSKVAHQMSKISADNILQKTKAACGPRLLLRGAYLSVNYCYVELIVQECERVRQCLFVLSCKHKA
jgi:hypothetical protein